MADARIVIYAASAPPAGWYECNGASLLRADEPDLFAALGTRYGAADGTHFNLPDLRERFALGKAALGTGSALAEAGGQLGHQHGFTHSHTATQPSDHAAHVVTQPGAHAGLAHAGFAAEDHPAASHAGITVAAHVVSKSNSHGTHDSAGSHDHDNHNALLIARVGSGSTPVMTDGARHSSAGGHTHDAHSAHNESVTAHSITSQGANHGVAAHVATQPSAHALAAHAFTVSAHSVHTGAAAQPAATTLDAADPPYAALLFIVAPALTPLPAGVVVEFGSVAVPADHLACDGASVLRADYADLFAAIGTVFGAVDGTHFTLPDLRGMHVLGAGAGAAFGTTGGAAGHVHGGPSHSHTVTQPGDHTDHVVTQPSHPALAHTGAALNAHSLTHTGFAVGNHTVTQSSSHGTHSAAGSHTHDGHSFAQNRPSGADLYSGPSQHSADGSHTHDSHGAHAGASLSAHAESQANTHTATHSVTQPDDHPVQTHAGAALTPHDSHVGAALNAANLADGAAAEAPFLALAYMIRTTLGTQPVGGLYRVGQSSAPAGTLLCQGQAVSRATYAALFAEIGITWGPGDGASTFNVPDARGRIPRGANGDLAAAGGALDHTHAVSATHGHGAVQPTTHGAHDATQPGAHGSLGHANAAATTHTLTHSGLALANHTAGQANAHGEHSSPGNHNHNNHVAGTGISELPSASLTVTISPAAHANEGGHTHDSTHAHSGFGVDPHVVGQAGAHSLAHAVTQPDPHAVSAHADFAVNAHAAHAGFGAVAGGTGTTDAANPPYLVFNYVIQALEDVFNREAELELAIGTPEFHITGYEITLNDEPLTPPSSPIIYVVEPPE